MLKPLGFCSAPWRAPTRPGLRRDTDRAPASGTESDHIPAIQHGRFKEFSETLGELSIVPSRPVF
jgi:hypothetical protein